MRVSGTAKWVLLALAGLAVAIGIAIVAANLTSRQIGIASESVSAGDALAPSLQVPAEGKPHRSGDRGGPEEETSTTPSPLPPATTEEGPPPSEELTEPASPGEGGGDDRGRGPDGDD